MLTLWAPWPLAHRQVLSILPQAHAYGLASVVDDCMAASASFTYWCGGAPPGDVARANALAFMEMSERLQVCLWPLFAYKRQLHARQVTVNGHHVRCFDVKQRPSIGK